MARVFWNLTHQPTAAANAAARLTITRWLGRLSGTSEKLDSFELKILRQEIGRSLDACWRGEIAGMPKHPPEAPEAPEAPPPAGAADPPQRTPAADPDGTAAGNGALIGFRAG